MIKLLTISGLLLSINFSYGSCFVSADKESTGFSLVYKSERVGGNFESPEVLFSFRDLDSLKFVKASFVCSGTYREETCKLQNGVGKFDIIYNPQDYQDISFKFSKDFKIKLSKKNGDITEFKIPEKYLQTKVNRFFPEKICSERFMKNNNYETPRIWNEAILYAIRNDFARPTVTARNLYHLSVVLWDTYVAFDKSLKSHTVPYFFESKDIRKISYLRNEAMNYAAHYFLKQRYKNAPGNINGSFRRVDRYLDITLQQQGLNAEDVIVGDEVKSARDLGLFVAKKIINLHMEDGSREINDYAGVEGEYKLINKNPLDISGLGTELLDINSWQPLYLPEAIDQSGEGLDWNIQPPLTLFWGELPTFSDLSKYKSENKKGVYFEQMLALPFYQNELESFVSENLKVVIASSFLDPLYGDGASFIDISPNSMGNSDLGFNNGVGYTLNPMTNKPYKPELVKQADFYRALAEFWADGPDSETPPGHWNVIANEVMDSSEFSWKWMGKGQAVDKTLYQLKMYLTLNGALHDSAIVAWGIKGHFLSARPISVVRHLAHLAETDVEIEKLITGQSSKIEKITHESVKKGNKHYHLRAHVGKIAAYAWRGHYNNEDASWADCRDRGNVEVESRLSRKSTRFCEYEVENIKGADWILLKSWMPYQRITFVTPPFPGFVSGHSTFSRAAAEVLAGVTGSPYFPGGIGRLPAHMLVFENGPSEHFEFQWATYFDASDQSGISRVFGGIHAGYDDLPARRIGSEIGKEALKTQQLLFE